MTIEDLQKYTTKKKSYQIFDVLKNHIMPVKKESSGRAIVYEFDSNEVYSKLRSLAVDASNSGKWYLFDSYMSYIEIFRKMKDDGIR